MKILMITPYLPFPLSSGGQIRTFNLLKNLSKKHQITLFSFIRKPEEEQHIERLKEFCVDVKVFMKRPPWSVKSLFLSAVTLYPLVVCMYLKRQVQQEIKKAIEREHFDLIHAETFYVMPNIPQNDIPIILAEQTIEYLVYQHYTETVHLLPLKWIMNYDVRKIFHWEKTYWARAAMVVAMSEADKQTMQQVIPGLSVNLVPNGVDTEFFKIRSRKTKNDGKTVLFVGNFKWLQNREAVSILVEEIWPVIKKRLPQAKLWIVGRYPPKTIEDLATDDIRISSDIEDIRQAYSNSDVLLAPIYGPGGTRYKILESMATGLPVVTTSTGIEGLGAENDTDAVICSGKKELAEATIRVLTKTSLHNKLGENGRRLVEKKFNWKSIASQLDRLYEETAYGKKN